MPTAKRLLSDGWRVALVDILEEEKAQGLLDNSADRAMYIKCDLANYEDQAQMYQDVWSKWGRLDAVIANGSIVDKQSLLMFDRRGSIELPPAPDLACTDVVAKGSIYAVRLATHFMRQNRNPGGHIVLVGSGAGLYSLPLWPEYASAKAAVSRVEFRLDLPFDYAGTMEAEHELGKQVMSYGRAMAPILKAKENILLNIVVPSIVRVGAITGSDVLAGVGFAQTTSIESIVEAYVHYVNVADTSGEMVEVSAEKPYVVPRQPLVNGEASRVCRDNWGPWFKMIHGEPSNIPGEQTW
ncbi:uncharacterized protein Z518_04615 [Rhinocladiella mackenziei CBS 650.93]|uniref:Uncharacterized protein n=1 Tax=Rhinocladiella mackenziei CBS 650.93 TaxID=1442369 RepID=A0A0D2ILL7_9EURO|nr:uncharacterized protein Z518_04615 [Rhinocladiella mackenziei CBS 650.93]KIX06639.1 hypothetical protein Z518_04615 [Rhinocladiella mackenziei CBS 650.93]